MSAPPPQPAPDNGVTNGNVVKAIDGIIARSETARERFDEELDGLIDDLRDARAMLRKEEQQRHDADTGEGRGLL